MAATLGMLLLIMCYVCLLWALVRVVHPLAGRTSSTKTWLWFVAYVLVPPVAWYHTHYVFAREVKGMSSSRSRSFAVAHSLFFFLVGQIFIPPLWRGPSCSFVLVPFGVLFWFLQPLALIVQKVRGDRKIRREGKKPVE